MTTTAAHEPSFVIDVVYEAHRAAAARPPKERTAAWLQLIQRQAALCPDLEDPPPDHPGAAKTYWRSARSEFPGVSEFFVDELAAVLGVGRGTAAHRATRAFTWRDSLPATFAALQRGEIDERRAQIFADTLEHTPAALARRVEAVVLPEAGRLGFDPLKKR